MHMNACIDHAKSQKPTSNCLSILFHLVVLLSLLLTTNYTRITIQLDSITTQFIAQLLN